MSRKNQLEILAKQLGLANPSYFPFNLRERLQFIKEMDDFPDKDKRIRLLELLIEEYGDDYKAALKYWWETYSAHQKVKYSYTRNNVTARSKMDNKDKIVYTGGGGNRSKIRIPKKNRKNAWKKFYKLFPMLKPKTEKDEK